MGRSLEYLSSIGSVELSEGVVETLCQLAQELDLINAMVLRQFPGILGIVPPHQVDQELQLLRV